MRRNNATTLQDVARETGVAAMTVSVVLNGSRSATRVSDATRARIVEAAARLHYRPNAVARSLSRRRMDTIGIAAIVDECLNLYFLELLNGVLAAAARHGQNSTVLSVTDWGQDRSRLLQFCDGRVDGLLLIAPHLPAAFGEALARHAPFVTIHSTDALAGAHNLEVDNEGGAYALVRHMITQGHQRLAHFTGSLDSPSARQRLDGYRRALAEAGLEYDAHLVLPGDFTMQSGRERMDTVLDRPGPRPTSVFCANDGIAYGALEVLTAHGLRAPADMSIGGFDDLILAQMTTPHLTTVRQPFRAMGQKAVDVLLHRIEAQGAEEDTISVETFPAELIVRDSVGPPPEMEHP